VHAAHCARPRARLSTGAHAQRAPVRSRRPRAMPAARSGSAGPRRSPSQRCAGPSRTGSPETVSRHHAARQRCGTPGHDGDRPPSERRATRGPRAPPDLEQPVMKRAQADQLGVDDFPLGVVFGQPRKLTIGGSPRRDHVIDPRRCVLEFEQSSPRLCWCRTRCGDWCLHPRCHASTLDFPGDPAIADPPATWCDRPGCWSPTNRARRHRLVPPSPVDPLRRCAAPGGRS